MQEKASNLHILLPLKPIYGGGFLQFHQDRAQVFVNADCAPYFSAAHRGSIVEECLRDTEWGAGIDVRAMAEDGFLVRGFLAHVQPERGLLERYAVWGGWDIRKTPLRGIKAYFGARVAIYYAWLLFYVRMLAMIAVISVPVGLGIWYMEGKGWSVDLIRVLWGVGLCFWGAYWTENWKRRNKVLQAKWGLGEEYRDNDNHLRAGFRGTMKDGFYCQGGFVDLHDLSTNRDADNGSTTSLEDDGSETVNIRTRDRRRSSLRRLGNGDENGSEQVVVIGGENDPDFLLEAPVTGLMFSDLPRHPYFSKRVLVRRMWVSAAVTAFFAAMVALASFMILWYKRHIVAWGWSFLPGVMTGLVIVVADRMWRPASVRLTRWENHRTIDSFENSLIVKRFAFQFVSSKCE